MSSETADTVDVLDDAARQSLYALALRYYAHHMYTESVLILQFLIRHEPNRPHYYRALGKAWHATGRHEQAVQAYVRAIRLGLMDADLHFYIAQCLIFTGSYGTALPALDRCLALARLQAHSAQGHVLINKASHLRHQIQKKLNKSLSASILSLAGQRKPAIST